MLKEVQKLQSTAHELFHGYQYDKGQTFDGSIRTVNNEIRAYIFGRSVTLSASYGILGWGNATTAGTTYDQATKNENQVTLLLRFK